MTISNGRSFSIIKANIQVVHGNKESKNDFFG